MLVNLSKTIRPSKLQPQIFKIFKQMQTSKKDDYLIVVDSDNNPMGAIIPQSVIADLLLNNHEISYDLKDFYKLGDSSFEFWNNNEDDIYAKFYN